MSIRNKNDIRVYSELPFQINLVGQHKEYVFPPCENNEPTMNFVSWEDIEYANSRGNLFSLGLLVFNKNDQEEIYNELGIRNWKDTVWREADIDDAIKNPTLEKMQRIIDIKNAVVLERIRSKVVYYTNEGVDISQNVTNIVNARYRELMMGISGSKIVIKPKDVEKGVSADEVADLKKQLAEMQEMMKQMSAKNDESENHVENNQASAPKRSTRKATAKK